MYDAVLTFDDPAAHYFDPIALGNVLADHVDAGGGLVVMQFGAIDSFQTNLTGRWTTGGYGCLLPGKYAGMPSSSLKAMPNDPKSPLVQGITGITTTERALPAMGSLLNNAKGATSVWDYQDGAPGICLMTFKGRPRVDINLYPGPQPMFYTEGKAGDGAALMKNALVLVALGGNPLQAMPSPVMFPDTGNGAVSSPITVTYTNTGMAAQTVTSLSVGGMHPGDFAFVKAPALPLAVAPNMTFTADVVFQPTMIGARSGVLQATVMGLMSTADCPLTGTALATQIKVVPNKLTVGGTQLGMSITKDVVVSNTGNNPVKVTDAQITVGQAAFSVTSAFALPVTLIAGGTLNLTVHFTPQMNGATTGTLTISSTDPNAPSLPVSLVGYAGPPMIAVDAATVAFGSVNLGAASPAQPVLVRNTGFADLNVTDVVVGGKDAGDFSVDKGTTAMVTVAPKALDFGSVKLKTWAMRPSISAAASPRR